MSEAALFRLTEQGLGLVLYGAGLPVLAGAVAGAVVELLQRRAGVQAAGLPGAARLGIGLLTLLALGPAVAAKLGRFAGALWTALPLLGS